MKTGGSIGRLLYQLATKGDKEQFFKLVDTHKVFSNLGSLDATEASLLIKSFSTLKVDDKSIWRNLEKLFLAKEAYMNIQDTAFCASAFSKKSHDKEIWGKLEEHVLSHYNYIYSSKDIVMYFYAFAQARAGSPELWGKLEELCSKIVFKVNQKEIAMMVWAFGHMNKGSSQFWKTLEQVSLVTLHSMRLQNMSLITYSFSKMKKGSHLFWKQIEISLITEFKKASDIEKPQDVANIAWGFANAGAGSPVFWEEIEAFARRHLKKFSLMDLSNVAWALWTAKQEKSQFWSELASEIKNLEKVEEKSHPDVVLLGETLTQLNYEDAEMWNKLKGFFIGFMKKELYNNSLWKASWHKKFYEIDERIWDSEVEEIYLKGMRKELSGKVFYPLQAMVNVCICAFPQFGSDLFWENMLSIFLGLLKSSNCTGLEENVFLVSKMVYILSAKFGSEKKTALMQNLNIGLDGLYETEKDFSDMTKNKRSLVYQLKGMVYQQANAPERTFWNQLKKHRDQFVFEQKDIELLIFAIIVKNKLFFEREKKKELDEAISQYCVNNQEKVDILIKSLFDILLSYSGEKNAVKQQFEGDEEIKKLGINRFLTDVESKEFMSQGMLVERL